VFSSWAVTPLQLGSIGTAVTKHELWQQPSRITFFGMFLSKIRLPVVPHKAVAEVSKKGAL
jgi:hypothetical protein